MFSRKITGIMIILLLAAGIAITTTRCYDDKNEARVTIHLERNDLAAMGIQPQPEKHFIDRVLEFFSTPAEAASTWDGGHYDLTLSIICSSFETITVIIPAGTNQYSLILPTANNVTFTITSYYDTGGFKNWGGHKTLNLGPGDQDITINMIPMVYISNAFGGTSDISLEWYSTSASGNTQSYNIYRSTSSNGTYLFIKNVLPTSSPESTIDIPSPGTYYYRITVVTTNGEEGVPCDYRSATRS